MADHGQVIVHKEMKYIVHNLIIHAGSMKKITAGKRDEVQGSIIVSATVNISALLRGLVGKY